jgi:hypothetical protein
MDLSGVCVNESARHIDVMKELERNKKGTDVVKNVPTPKLTATGSGDWLAFVTMVHSGYFSSRDRCDELLIPTDQRVETSQCIKANTISLKGALEKMNIELSVNMDYYLQNTSEMDADLGYKVSDRFQLNNKQAMRKLGDELFYKVLCSVFGKESADDQLEVDGEEKLSEKSFVIRDFNILSSCGNCIRATAVRDEYYLLFIHDY